MTWGAPIWIYLWAAGMAGGAYLAGFVVDLFTKKDESKHIFKLAVYLGIPLVIIGVLLLIIDLGSPLWFWHLFTQFKVVSPMSMGTWILIAWVVFALLLAVVWVIEGDIRRNASLYPARMPRLMERLSGFLPWIGLLLSMAVMSYTGVLIAVSNQPIWASTPLLPALFTASAISTGVALLVLTAFVTNAVNKSSSAKLNSAVKWLFGSTGWTIPNKMIGRLAEADAIVIIVESAVLIGYSVWLGTSSAAGASEALALLTTGPVAILFWIGVVLLALLLPLALDLFNWGKKLEEKSVMYAITLSALSVLVGGLILRAVIVMGGQI